ncbi:11359_t:CDS:2, partial [Acaulospora morrowiae]
NLCLGEEVASFFLKSNLSPTELAQIWDLVDIKKSGRLSRDEFAVGIHLITKKLKGEPLPPVLPKSLIPPSMRSSQASSSSPFTEIMKRSGTITKSISTPVRSQSVSNQFSSVSDLLFDTSPSPFPPQSQNSNDIDLLGDTDITTQMALEGGEIRNLKTQADNFDIATMELKNKRTNVDVNLASLATQKSEISVRISQLRTLYDTELKALQEVQIKYQLEHESVERAREELAQVERSLASLQQEKEQLEANIQKDREETLDIKRRMRIAEEENVNIKAEIEKLKKDSKQQKGLLAINREQLVSVEGEKEKSFKALQSMENRGIMGLNDPFGSGTFTPPPFGQSSNNQITGSTNSQYGLELEDNNYQPKPFGHSQHASVSSLSGNGVKRTMSNASLASNSTLGTSSIKSAPLNSSKLEEITFDKPNSTASSKTTELNNLFGENLPNTLQEINQSPDGSEIIARNVNPFETTFSSPVSTINELKMPLQTNIENSIQNSAENEIEKISTDPFSSFGSSTKSTSGKAGFDLAFTSISLPNNDNIVTDSFAATDFPSLEEIEASVESGAKLGFDNDFTSTEKKNGDALKEEVTNEKVGDSVTVEVTKNEPEVVTAGAVLTQKESNEEEKKNIIDVFSDLNEKGFSPTQDSDAWVSIENTTDSKIIKDEFEAAFGGDLSEVKVTKTSPIEFEAGFEDTDFDEDFKFNPTFETPIIQTKPIVPDSSNNNITSSFKNTSSIDLSKTFGDFDPFPSS